MYLSITGLLLGNLNTISIPIDAILLVSILMIFVLLGYFFNNILDNHTKQFVEETDNDSNLELVKAKLEDQLILNTTTLDPQSLEKPSIKKLHALSPPKLLAIGSFAVVAIGGSSLIGLHTTHKSYEGVKSSQVNIIPKQPSTKSLLSMVDIKTSDQARIKIKKINYVYPLLSTINSSQYNNYYQITKKTSDKYFFF